MTTEHPRYPSGFIGPIPVTHGLDLFGATRVLVDPVKRLRERYTSAGGDLEELKQQRLTPRVYKALGRLQDKERRDLLGAYGFDHQMAADLSREVGEQSTGFQQPNRTPLGTLADVGQAAGMLTLGAIAPMSFFGGSVLPEAARPGIEKLPEQAQVPAEIGVSLVGGGLGLGKVVEKGTSALAKLAGVARGGTPKVPQPVVQAPQTAVDSLVEALKAHKPARAEQEALYHAARSETAAKMSTILQPGGGEGAFRKVSSVMGGELPRMQATPIRDALRPEQSEALFNQVLAHAPWERLPFTKKNAADALVELLDLNQPLQRNQIKLLEEVFGPKLSEELLSRRPFIERAGALASDVLNLPKAFKATLDFSAVLRQGFMLGVRNPVESSNAFRQMFRSAFSERNFQSTNEAIKAMPWYARARESGLYLAEDTLVALTAREEQFASRLASKIPGIRMSERAYNTFLNTQRMGVFSKYAKMWAGTEAERELPELAKFINQATGRGSLGRLEDKAALLSSPFFSLRFAVSRPQMLLRGLGSQGVGGQLAAGLKDPKALLDFVSANPKTARAVASQNLVSFVGANVALLALLKYSDIAEVELDPRSSDFGKYRVGPVRGDLWAGFLPVARLVAQLMTGERKALASGNIEDYSRVEAAMRFWESKLTPLLGTTIDLARGEDAVGQPNTVWSVLKNLFLPLSVEDIMSAVAANGIAGGLAASPTVLGAGTQAFLSNEDVRDREAQKLGFADYASVPRERKPEIEQSEAVQERLSRREHAAKALWESQMETLAADPQARTDPDYFRNQFAQINRDFFVRQEPVRDKVKEYGERNENEKARNEYYAVFQAAEEASKGLRNDAYYTALQKGIAQAEAGWTPEQKEYVRNNIELRQYPDPFLQDYARLGQQLRDLHWWDMGQQMPLYQADEGAARAYDRILDNRAKGLPERTGIDTIDFALGKTIDLQVEAYQKNLRKASPELDVLLVRYYGRAPVTPEGVAEKGARIIRLMEERKRKAS